MKRLNIKSIISGGVILGILALFTACSDRTADIIITDDFYNDMTMMIIEDGQQTHPVHTPPEPVNYTVKKGDETGSIIITSVSDKSIRIKTNSPYVLSGESEPKQKFTVNKGSSICLFEYGICDATHTITIEYCG